MVFVVLVAVQIRSIVTSPFPGLRAIEALGTSLPLFLLLFASTYVVVDTISAGNFRPGSRAATASRQAAVKYTVPSPSIRSTPSPSRDDPHGSLAWANGLKP